MNTRAEVALANGMKPADLPKFTRHVHPETGQGSHAGWHMCLATSCTWVSLTDEARALIPRQPVSSTVKEVVEEPTTTEEVAEEPTTVEEAPAKRARTRKAATA